MGKVSDISNTMKRCEWVRNASEIEIHYHDSEWGVPCFGDQLLFEMLILEGAQAGLSWSTVLNKRENYRLALDGFNPEKIARYGDREKVRLRNNPGIIRNRLKIDAAVNNAVAFLQVLNEFASFSEFIWQFVDGEPRINNWKHHAQIPTSTPISERMSKALKNRGFKFVGPTICYAYMQGIGMVNDHTCDCFRYAVLAKQVRS